jgi:hypothetical protein
VILQTLRLCAVLSLAALPAPSWAEADTKSPPPSVAGSAAEAPAVSWDQPANIKAAAEHLGQLQKTRGAKSAYDFISACYKTQGLAETYSANFEACIAQDYMQTQVLAQIYSRMTPEQLRNLRAPSAPQLAEAMGQRVVAAFSQYKIPASYGDTFKKLVDQHGFPVFLALVFPKAQARDAERGGADKPSKLNSKPKSE